MRRFCSLIAGVPAVEFISPSPSASRATSVSSSVSFVESPSVVVGFDSSPAVTDSGRVRNATPSGDVAAGADASTGVVVPQVVGDEIKDIRIAMGLPCSYMRSVSG